MPPPNPAIFFNRLFSGLLDRHEEGDATKKNVFMYVLVCKGLSNDDVGVDRGSPYFRRIRPEAGSHTGDFVKEKLAGSTVERPRTRYDRTRHDHGMDETAPPSPRFVDTVERG